MKRILFILLLFTIYFAGYDSNSRISNKKLDETSHNFKDNWHFARGIDSTVLTDYFERGSEVDWEAVSLPHTAYVELLVIDDQQWQGTAFYRKFLKYLQRIAASISLLNSVRRCMRPIFF